MITKLACAAGVLSLGIHLVIGAIVGWAFLSPDSFRESLPGVSFTLDGKAMRVAVKGRVPVKAHFAHQFPVRLDTVIPIDLPVSSLLSVPVRETLEVGLKQTIQVPLDQPVRVRDAIRVQGRIPVDTAIETEILGVTTHLPVRGVIPLDFELPLDQELRVTGIVDVKLPETLSIDIDQRLKVPLNFKVESTMHLRKDVSVAMGMDLDGEVTLPESFPTDIDLELHLADLVGRPRP